GTALSSSSATTRAASWRRRALRGYPSRSHRWRTSAVGAAARSAGVGHASIHSRQRGSTLATGVCWDMISLTRTAQALVPGSRHGSSRAEVENHEMIVVCTCRSTGSATSGKGAAGSEGRREGRVVGVGAQTKQKTAYEVETGLEFRRGLFRSPRQRGSTLATGVCWDMISLTRTAQALVPGSRHGSSRAEVENHEMIVVCTCRSTGSATSGKGAADPGAFVSRPLRCVIWMLFRFGLGSKR